jgi:hypothetical protein
MSQRGAFRRGRTPLRSRSDTADGRRPQIRARQGAGAICSQAPRRCAGNIGRSAKRWPDFQSAEGHLLYARSLAEAGRLDEALEEYHAVSAYFPGAEARVRYGLLRMVGRTAEARIVFNELLLQMKRAPKYLRDAHAEWLANAEKQLSA